ncbi:MAG: hypothetical protein P1U46_04160 [Patescibacteria group bacterium]|nr:hypothetical protein [Patescibacteria group bacterium]
MISNIESNLLLLKKVNKKDYDYAKNIIDIYIKSIVYSFENNEIKKINFLNLWNKIENRNITVKESIKSKISDIYIKYDYENTYLFTNLSQLIKNLKLELDENEYIYFSNYINKLTSY